MWLHSNSILILTAGIEEIRQPFLPLQLVLLQLHGLRQAYGHDHSVFHVRGDEGGYTEQRTESKGSTIHYPATSMTYIS